MKIRAQIGTVLNLDKYIGCHICSAICRNIWTSRDGVEYAWSSNVETKPGIDFPKNWEDQEEWNGDWMRKPDGKLMPKQGGRLKIPSNILVNPNLSQMDGYYEPFTYDYEHLQDAPKMKVPPTARPVSVLTGKKMDKVEWGPNWEDDLVGELEKRAKDILFEGIQKEMMSTFEQVFMMYLPRLCKHCLDSTCVASCPSDSIYKREDDGIVLINQDKCHGWRICVSGCLYKRIYYNWISGKAEKCIFCYPCIGAGEPTVCSETCVGRTRYLGVLLHDADKIEEAASVEDPQDLYEAQLGVFFDLHDPEVQREALKQGISQSWLSAAKKPPVYKVAMEWKIAFLLHPEYRTLPVVQYIPPPSPIQSAIGNGLVDENGIIPSMDETRAPLRYLANLLTAGKIKPIKKALECMIAMRRSKRGQVAHGETLEQPLDGTGLTPEMVEDMYQIMAIANYGDRFMIPTSHKEMVENSSEDKASCGFPFGNGRSGGSDGLTQESLFGKRKASPIIFFDRCKDIEKNKEEGVR